MANNSIERLVFSLRLGTAWATELCCSRRTPRADLPRFLVLARHINLVHPSYPRLFIISLTEKSRLPAHYGRGPYQAREQVTGHVQ